MTFPEKVKSYLLADISDMALCPATFSKNPLSDFTRNRSLPFDKLIQFCISMESNTLNQELLKAFGFGCNTPSASAFCQQRSKLKVDTFSHLLRTFNSHFPFQKYKEKYTLIACDGSEFNIPRNPADTSTFNPPNKTALQGFNMMHTVSLYDVLSKRYLDVVVQPGREKDEFRALCELTDRYSYGGSPIFLADRGFASYNVFAHALENKIDFIIRAKDLNTKRMLGLEELPPILDTSANLILSKTTSKKKHRNTDKEECYRYICKNVSFDYLSDEQAEYTMTLRVVRFELSNGIYENIITTLPADEFPLNEIKKLYWMRWQIENSFRDLKHTIGATYFHSKKFEYIQQEILCRLLLYNFCSVIILCVSIKPNETKNIYQVNFVQAMKICITFLRWSGNSPPLNVKGLIGKYILPVRPDRNYARQHRIQHPASFAYRFQ